MGSSKSQDEKVVSFQGPATIATNATSATTIDTLGFDYVVIDVIHNPATNTSSSAKWTALKLMHGTTTDATNHTNISGAVGTTNSTASSSQFVLPEHNNTTNGGVVRFFVNLGDKERILRIEKHAAASHATTCNIALLGRANDVPDSASDRGVGAQVFV